VVEDTLKRIGKHPNVLGVIVLNKEGATIRSTMDTTTTVMYASQLSQLARTTMNAVRELDPQNSLTFLRIRSKKHEIMVAPERDYMLIVVQNHSTTDRSRGDT